MVRLPEQGKREKQIHRVFIKRTYLEMILDGEKDIEVRVGYGWVKRINPGDELVLNNTFRARVKDVRRYDSLGQLLDNEDINRIVPGSTREQALSLFQRFYSPEKEKLGLYALELEA